MQAFLDARQALHDPQFRLSDGAIVQNPDRPDRVAMLKAGAEAAGAVFAPPTDHGMGPLAAVHTPRYLSYLRGIFDRYGAPRQLREIVPSRTNPESGHPHYSYEPDGLIGFHNADTSCPISAQTWNAVYWSAQTALSGADCLLAGERFAYALSRPSGHHAYAERSGGFCFLNNAAIAANYLRRQDGRRVAVVDIDVHHGNGTQSIFYARDDVFTASLHVDPAQFYPYYAGGSQETGTGRGLGYNLNCPLPQGTTTEAYLAALEGVLEHVECYGAETIVLALGLDTHEGDPFQGMKVTTEGFAAIAQRFANLKLPVLCVQEGGYMQPALGDNVTAFLGALKFS